MILTDEELKEHTLNRTGCGISPASAALYDDLGFEAYIDWQLDKCTEAGLLASQALGVSIPSIGPSGFPRVHVQQEGQLGYAARTKVIRPIVKLEQLADVLADFWFNHFNVQCATAGSVGFWRIGYVEFDAARHAMASFREMLQANAFSHQMMEYLDNIVNNKGSNENLGREILELHTVGIDGGYDQDDVVDASRIISGWTGGVNYSAGPANPEGVLGLSLMESRHSKLAKTVMGVNYPANANASVEQSQFLDQLASHPSTQLRMSYKLCQLFVADDPPADLVAATRDVWAATGGDLHAVTRSILLGSAFRDREHFRSKHKRPRHFVASVARGLGRSATTIDDDIGFWKPPDIDAFQPTYENTSLPVDFVERMGEVLFRNGTPTGHSFDSRDWVSGAIVGLRFELLSHAGEQWLSGLSDLLGLNTPDTIEALVDRLLPGGISAATGAAITSHIAELDDAQRLAEAAVLVMGSPEFGAC